MPQAGSPALTSTFGEYRSGHYHGGMDFSTQGRTGIPVAASSSGWVFRIRMSGVGYGRALYLRLEDGRTLVLAHLSRFRDDIAQAAHEEQRRLERYEVDFYPARRRLTFTQGEIVAWTGASGAGPPHLHAEIREGAEAAVAVNPKLHGWSPDDSLPPVMDRIRLAPRGPESHVEGAFVEAEFPLDEGKTDTVRVHGPLRLWVRTVDYTRPGGARTAPRSVEARLDGSLVGSVTLDRFDWRYPAEVEWTFHEVLVRTRNERWICLDAPDRTRQQIHQGPGLTELVLTPGTHTLELIAADNAGNKTTRSMVLESARGTRTQHAPSWGSLGPVPKEFSKNDAVLVRIAQGNPKQKLAFQGFLTELATTDFYEDGWVAVRRVPLPEVQSQELLPVSPVFRLEPWGTPLRNRVEVVLPIPDQRAGCGIYSWDGKEWDWEGNTRDPSGLRTGIRNLEMLAVLEDRTPPKITVTRPGGVVPAGSRPRLEVALGEQGSGLAWRDLHMTLDGNPVPAEWDPDARRFGGRPFYPLDSGAHEWVIRVSDRAGNAASLTRTISVR